VATLELSVGFVTNASSQPVVPSALYADPFPFVVVEPDHHDKALSAKVLTQRTPCAKTEVQATVELPLIRIF
jgi:hypothetical protein